MSEWMTETWTDDGERFAVIDYDERDICEVTREAMHAILQAAGYVRADIPEPPPRQPGSGRERLARVADALQTDAGERIRPAINALVPGRPLSWAEFSAWRHGVRSARNAALAALFEVKS